MICHYCCRGYIADGFDVRPCPECGGCGIVHCCEGERPDQCAENMRRAPPGLAPADTIDEARRDRGERCEAAAPLVQAD
jgi:hypothetical protein